MLLVFFAMFMDMLCYYVPVYIISEINRTPEITQEFY